MSLRRGDRKKGAPKHRNSFAFRHNKNSKKSAKIAAIPNQGLCRRCHEKIEWRKKYRKYKPIKAPRKCNFCQQKRVKFAYHVACEPCATQRKVCAKCMEKHKIVSKEAEAAAQIEEEIQMLEAGVPGMRERDRRARIRALCRELDGEGGDGAAGSDKDAARDGAAAGEAGGDAESTPAATAPVAAPIDEAGGAGVPVVESAGVGVGAGTSANTTEPGLVVGAATGTSAPTAAASNAGM